MSEQETKLEQVEDRVEKRWPKWLAPQIRGDVSRHDLPTAIIAAFGWLCYLAFLLMLIWVVGTLVHNDMLEKEAARNITEASRSWSVQRKNAELEKAYAYNHDLRKYFNGRILADTTNENDATIEREDARYNSTLNVDGNGGMARLVIPKISVDIPVGHTTLAHVLNRGAGHVYGTDMPVGESGTLSAIAAHSGGFQGLLFTRLNELDDGDTFEIQVAGETQVYRVFNKRTILPDQLEDNLAQIRDMEGRNDNAIVTLITCTPLGVNTHRLLVSGIRVPDSQAKFAYNQGDGRLRWFLIGVTSSLIALLLGLAFLTLWKKGHGLPRLKHCAGWQGVSPLPGLGDDAQ
ncbi:class C sortase [Bifidobacterium animalis]|uniref:class C sortase n=1 Tax=Bifidobacterium animalis TaxID=28025 RepID=UPI0006992B0B|nr:class C sortase [Bifidobacterium animalis]ARE60185.1 class C sortase [Bifidobacterium animalis subsp. animalis]KOA58822.1 hypothetical protein BAAM0499_08095 [Bifidobacterium animalis subsp. animalis MCC 0499]PHQ53604.1 class C sortase [Bifidobacterium animalis subsp. animalis]QQQ90650.1 class C sortase [Bifidobacterium animalis]UQE62858.1 class C sortase [Bifidobacterium animalis]